MLVLCGGYDNPRGYCSIHHLANLAARLFEASVTGGDETSGRMGYGELARGLLGRRARNAGPCLVICRAPADMRLLVRKPHGRSRFGATVAWIIDSFAWEAIPRSIRLLRPFDHIFVAGLADVEETRRRTGIPTSWLPIGTDALEYGDDRADRPVDVLRIGRQPAEWNDDQVSEAACRSRGLSFHGRPPFATNPRDNQIALHRHCADAKFCLAFSNTVAPAAYNHPTRAYLTPRWADALASGATTAGARPEAPGIDQLLWPEATLELGGIDRERGLDILVEAVRDWRPERAERNRLMALKRLDWRWRLGEIAKFLNLSPPPLLEELDRLRAAIADRSESTAAGSTRGVETLDSVGGT